MKKFNLSFIIPCYDADKFITKNIDKLIKFIKNKKYNYEIILINDGSTDQTLKKIKKIILKHKKVKIINNKENYGKSYSVRKGLKKAKYNYVILMDCDLPYFNVLNKVIMNVLRGNDLVLVNRRIKESKIILSSGFYKRVRVFIGDIIGKILNLTLNLEILGNDTQAGLKAFKKLKNFKKIKFISNKFFLDVEIINVYSNQQKKIKSIPVIFNYSNISSIKILSLKNFVILLEIIKVIFYLRFFQRKT